MALTWLLLVIFISSCDNLELWCLMFILDTPSQAQRTRQDVELGPKKGKLRRGDWFSQQVSQLIMT